MTVVHLTASTFYGGPERQMLGLADALPDSVRTAFVSFPEGGRCAAFLDVVRDRGREAVALRADFPRLIRVTAELTATIRELGCEILLCHGYKANLLGRVAARRVGVPAVAVSRGWTWQDRRVRAYEWLDRRHLRLMDHVVAVSEGQAARVRNWCGVPAGRVSVVRNSARLGAFATTEPARGRLLDFFPRDSRVSRVVVAAGRLSPEKGFGVLIDAATAVLKADPVAGVVIFGEGVLRAELEQQVRARGLTGRVVLPGFRDDLDSLLAAADVVTLPSFTEGLPNVALEASAAGVPVVATAVGGTPEVIADGETGYLVQPGRPDELADRLVQSLKDGALRARLGNAGRARMQRLFTFDAQAAAYLDLFARLRPSPVAV
ncbi:glycosyltransferase [Urbifossiella limnaea]|uniref:Alpha-D-kanosaminyltransferase n=1 Tax=Urbifossiella limnaea TaxID=2528023 RepID=A0A517XUJ0_9BACT|nr:glycosyltransferase [Urbifossiella limnaea]QDU21160.1 Alpha-D-kanosaminyltransferase [Urbifossiella limnaea]